MISFVLCWLYLANDRKISEIGNYISETLSMELANIIDSNNDVFAWELTHRAHIGRKILKLLQFAIEIIIFSSSSLAAIFMLTTLSDTKYIYYGDILFLAGIIILFIFHYSNKKITQEE